MKINIGDMIIKHPNQKERINLSVIEYYYPDHYTGLGCPGFKIVFLKKKDKNIEDYDLLHWFFMREKERDEALQWIDSQFCKEFPNLFLKESTHITMVNDISDYM
jgi:hypothetical protein